MQFFLMFISTLRLFKMNKLECLRRWQCEVFPKIKSTTQRIVFCLFFCFFLPLSPYRESPRLNQEYKKMHTVYLTLSYQNGEFQLHKTSCLINRSTKNLIFISSPDGNSPHTDTQTHSPDLRVYGLQVCIHSGCLSKLDQRRMISLSSLCISCALSFSLSLSYTPPVITLLPETHNCEVSATEIVYQNQINGSRISPKCCLPCVCAQASFCTFHRNRESRCSVTKVTTCRIN